MATAQDVTFRRYGNSWAYSNQGIETSGFEDFPQALAHYTAKFPEVLQLADPLAEAERRHNLPGQCLPRGTR